jgi:hypothetical protein
LSAHRALPTARNRISASAQNGCRQNILILTEVNLLQSCCVLDLAAELVNGAVDSISTERQFVVAYTVSHRFLQRSFVAQDAPTFLAG